MVSTGVYKKIEQKNERNESSFQTISPVNRLADECLNILKLQMFQVVEIKIKKDVTLQ